MSPANLSVSSPLLDSLQDPPLQFAETLRCQARPLLCLVALMDRHFQNVAKLHRRHVAVGQNMLEYPVEHVKLFIDIRPRHALPAAHGSKHSLLAFLLLWSIPVRRLAFRADCRMRIRSRDPLVMASCAFVALDLELDSRCHGTYLAGIAYKGSFITYLCTLYLARWYECQPK